MSRKPDPKSKASFVRSFPASTTAADVVAKAKAKRIKIDMRYVHAVRTAAKAKKKAPVAPHAGAKRQPRRPRRSAIGRWSKGQGQGVGGLEAAIEAIVERKVTELLKSKLGELFG